MGIWNVLPQSTETLPLRRISLQGTRIRDLGIDEEGEIYYTMTRVKGATLQQASLLNKPQPTLSRGFLALQHHSSSSTAQWSRHHNLLPTSLFEARNQASKLLYVDFSIGAEAVSYTHLTLPTIA